MCMSCLFVCFYHAGLKHSITRHVLKWNSSASASQIIGITGPYQVQLFEGGKMGKKDGARKRRDGGKEREREMLCSSGWHGPYYHYTTQADIKLKVILLPHPYKSWDSRLKLEPCQVLDSQIMRALSTISLQELWKCRWGYNSGKGDNHKQKRGITDIQRRKRERRWETNAQKWSPSPTSWVLTAEVACVHTFIIFTYLALDEEKGLIFFFRKKPLANPQIVLLFILPLWGIHIC